MSGDHSPSADETEYVAEDTPDGVTLGGVHHAVLGLTVQTNALSAQVIAQRHQINRQSARFDTFHGELSLMRGMLGDLIPRMTSVEKRTPKQVATKVVARSAIYGIPASVVLGIAYQILIAVNPVMGERMRSVFDAVIKVFQ